MKKKHLILLLLTLSTFSNMAYGKKIDYNIEHENATIYTIEKGKANVRDGIIQHKKGETGRSGSNQYIEYINGKNKYESRDNYNGYTGDVQGIVLGTTSTFKRTPDSTGLVGVTFSYINSDIDYDNSSKNDETDTFNFNAYAGYEQSGYVAIGYGGLSLGEGDKSGDKDSGVIGIEIGKIQPLFSGVLYPYASATGMRTFGKEYSYNDVKYARNIENKAYYRIGSEYRIEYHRYYAKVYVEYVGNHTNSDGEIGIGTSEFQSREELFSLDTDSVRYGALMGYKLDDTLILALEVAQVKSKNDDMLIGGIKIGHKF